jgi:hypothetical protein
MLTSPFYLCFINFATPQIIARTHFLCLNISMNEQKTPLVRLIGSAVEVFDASDIIEVQLDFPNEHPVRFAPYLSADASYDVMSDFGIDVLTNRPLQNLLTASIRVFGKDCLEQERQRRRLADRLNNPLH